MTQPAAIRSTASSPVSGILIAAVVLISAVGPLATDMYVPSFPRVAHDLAATAGEVSLTLTSFFLGMGLGQIIGGPVSDQLGRRRPLVGGILLTLVASVACALAPTIPLMVLARLAQGFGGGWSVVVARAVIVDLAQGPQLVQVMNLLMGVGGIGPIVAPLLGAVIQHVWMWRGAFWVLALAAVFMLVGALAVIPESLPPERRHSGGFTAFATAARVVLGQRAFIGYMLVNASAFLGLFAYVSTSAFVLQVMNGLNPITYSLVFAGNATGMTIATLTSARLASRVPTRRVILGGQALALTGALEMLVGAIFFDMPLAMAMIGFFCIMVGQGFTGANGGALASQQVPQYAGTASAVLGLAQSLAAAIAPPLAGLGGTTTAAPMAILMVVGAAGSLFSLLVIAAPRRVSAG